MLKKNNFQVAIALIILVVFSVVSFFLLIRVKTSSYKMVEVPINFSVSKEMEVGVGIIQGNILYFGQIPPGGFGRRELIITNSDKIPLKLRFWIVGNASELVSCTGNGSTIMPNEKITISCTANIPENATPSDWTGTAIFEFIK